MIYTRNLASLLIVTQLSLTSYIHSNTKFAANSTCSKPTIENGSVSPSDDTIEAGESYNVSCSDGYTLNGYDITECYDDGTLSRIPTCTGLLYGSKLR